MISNSVCFHLRWCNQLNTTPTPLNWYYCTYYLRFFARFRQITCRVHDLIFPKPLHRLFSPKIERIIFVSDALHIRFSSRKRSQTSCYCPVDNSMIFVALDLYSLAWCPRFDKLFSLVIMWTESELILDPVCCYCVCLITSMVQMRNASLLKRFKKQIMPALVLCDRHVRIMARNGDFRITLQQFMRKLRVISGNNNHRGSTSLISFNQLTVLYAPLQVLKVVLSS